MCKREFVEDTDQRLTERRGTTWFRIDCAFCSPSSSSSSSSSSFYSSRYSWEPFPLKNFLGEESEAAHIVIVRGIHTVDRLLWEGDVLSMRRSGGESGMER
jgi:hypothetical protein